MPLVFSHAPTYPSITPLTAAQVEGVNRMIVHSALEEFLSWKDETREGWFRWDGPLPTDAYLESLSDNEDECEILSQPELLDVRAFPSDHPFRRGMER